MSKTTWTMFFALVLLASLLAACGSTPEPTQAPEPTALPEPTEAAQPAESAASEDAALKITGNVSQEMGWTEDEVRAMETTKAKSTNSQGDIQTYTGVSLNKLLEMAGPAADATTVTFADGGGTTAQLTLAEIQGCADCIVSFRNKGGFSIVAPGFPDNVQVKGVIEIRIK